MDNRGPVRLSALGVAALALAMPAMAKDKKGNPSLVVEPITGRDLLSTTEPKPKLQPSYRLGAEQSLATGARARLSVDLGNTTLFAITGRLDRGHEAVPSGPLDGPQAKTILPRKESSRIYGGGAVRKIGPVEVSATYQYSKVNADRSRSNLDLDNPRSHNVQATARIRFRN